MTPTHEQIAKRAFEIYMGSGCLPGRDVQNWIQAENEVKKEYDLQAKVLRTVVTPVSVAALPKVQRPLTVPAVTTARTQSTPKTTKRLPRKTSNRIKLN